MRRLLLAAVSYFGLATAAHAITPVLESVTPDGSNYKFTYSATLAPDEGVRTGDRLVIFDFAGFVAFGAIPNPAINAFVENTTFVSNAPNQLRPVPDYSDDPTLPNLVLRWDGAPLFTVGPHPAFDFTFEAISIFGDRTIDGFTALTVKNNGDAIGLPIYTQGPAGVPLGAVPEPSTWAMMILGFGGLGAMMRRRRAAPAFA